MAKLKGDIDATYSAIRPRLARSAFGGATSAPTTVAPHHHHASEIIAEPEPTSALLSADDVQEGMEELGQEKLARTGEQEWIGPNPLNMSHFSIDNVHDADIEGTATVGEDVVFTGAAGLAKITNPREISFVPSALGEADIKNVRDVSFVGAIGEGIIDKPRVVHMEGDHVDDEAKIDGLERVVFNNEPTASSIEMPSRLDMNTGVTAGTDYTAAEGRVSWDTLEDTLVAYVVSGTGVVLIALGWGVCLAIDGYAPH